MSFLYLLPVIAGVLLFAAGCIFIGVVIAPRMLGPVAESCSCGEPLHCHRQPSARAMAAMQRRPAPINRVGRQATPVVTDRPEPSRRPRAGRHLIEHPTPAAAPMDVVERALTAGDNGETQVIPVVGQDATTVLPTIPVSPAPVKAAS